jgi:ribosome biogenesis GTPase
MINMQNPKPTNSNVLAQVLKSRRDLFDCSLSDGTVIEAVANGKIFKSDPPIPGDWVQLESLSSPTIIKIETRKNAIFRFQARERKKKLIASNVDLIALVFSMNLPEYKTGILDRYLVRCAQWEIPAIVIFTKIDLPHDATIDFENELIRVKNLVSGFYAVSSTKNEQASPIPGAQQYDDLKKKLANKTVLFMGQSGAGKTKLLSALADGKLDLKSSELSKSGKGAHTTTWAELIKLPFFNVMDSPGIRSFALSDLEADDIIFYFPDLLGMVSKCQYHNCAHNPDSKGCFLAKSINEQSTIDQNLCSRIESFWKIRSELDHNKNQDR